MKRFYVWEGSNLRLELQIQTRARCDAVLGVHNHRLKLAINALPEQGKANAKIVKFLANYFAIKPSQIHILTGQANRYKSIIVMAVENRAELSDRLTAWEEQP